MKVLFIFSLLICLPIYSNDSRKKDRSKLSPELQKKLESMSEEERNAFKEKMMKRRAELKEKMKDMTPQERESFMKEMKANREARSRRTGNEKKQDFKSMSDQEKKAFREQMKTKMAEKTKDMSAEEKENFINKMKEKRNTSKNTRDKNENDPTNKLLPQGIEPQRP